MDCSASSIPKPNGAGFTWTEAEIKQLKAGLERGLSMRQIGDWIGTKSRNACIGKANRLGLSQPTQSSVTRKANTLDRKQKARFRFIVQESVKGAPLHELAGCRWPVNEWPRGGSAKALFCNNTKIKDSSYCEFHFHKSVNWEAMSRSKRKVGRVMPRRMAR